MIWVYFGVIVLGLAQMFFCTRTQDEGAEK
jgi:hypothetical protein